MKSETQSKQPLLSDEEVDPEDAVAQPRAHRVPYKTLLIVVVVGIIAISALWILVIRQEGDPANATLVIEPDIQAIEDSEATGPQVARRADETSAIDRRLIALSGRIDRGFVTQQTHSSAVKRELSVMAESMQAIKAAIADLGKSNHALDRQISAARSRLDTIAQDIRTPKVVKRNTTARRKPRPVKIPPFHINAIDVWDDMTYVAVSQAGRVAFLMAGEQQSGWTVTHIDRLKGQVDLQGPAGQVHSVSLQR